MSLGLKVRRSFGYDLFSLIGPDMARGSVILSAFADKEIPWAQATLACSICCETAAKVALSLRTFREYTGKPINRKMGHGGLDLYEVLGTLVHHREIEISLQPPLVARSPGKDWISTKNQTRHRLENMIVKSDNNTIEVSLESFSEAIADEINCQINSPEGRKLKRESKWQSS